MIRRSLLFTALAAAGLFTAVSTQAAEIKIVNQDVGTGKGLDDPTPATPVGGNPGTTVGKQALNVYQFAADIWGAVLQSDVTISNGATFEPLSCDATSGVLGSSGTTYIFYFDDTSTLPAGAVRNTWYHSALFDALTHEDGAPGEDDIQSQFNGALGSTGCLEGSKWYFGLDGKTPAGSINFLNVVLHEMAHGLGFSGFNSLTTGSPYVGDDGVARPDIYSTFVYNDTQQKKWYDLTAAQRVTAALDDGKLVFTGPTVKAEAPLALGTPDVFHVTAPAAAVGDYTFSQASFGPLATASNFTGSVVQASPADGCTAITNGSALAGKIALIDRGTCDFTVKTLNAQSAGAKAVLIANNQAGAITPGGTPASPVTIPVIAISQADGSKLKANLTGLTGAVGKGTGLAGADAQGNVQLYAPTVLAQGSSFSHYDTRLTPNAIMEYAINQDLVGQIDVDLTPALFQDIGWGLNRTSQKLLTCDTGIPTLVPGGVIIGANVISNAKILAGAAATVGDYRSAVHAYATQLATDGLVTAAQASSLNACLSDTQTQAQYDAWGPPAAPPAIVLSNNTALNAQKGAAGATTAYQLTVPANAKTLTLRTYGGSGDVSISVTDPKGVVKAQPNRPGNSEPFTAAKPAAGVWTLTVKGEAAYSGVSVLGAYTL
ncbi:MAG: PA domain-containing protein [Luteibacter sp.]|uniref:PA domain-containing protein n=1 Tax=Luteibacter sp. TaxID=1886636 RepID=UPI00280847DC|nr:PA domain-containing protein [Luteibacter sp.]MDQ7994435.1 PA domain-containing protein [Luteibacter sp.]MDQ8050749.1 PA domain-containing protein [Luteibacter sp.]